MGALLHSFFYRLRRDLTFRIVAIVGLVLSIVFPSILFLADFGIYLLDTSVGLSHTFCNGQSLFMSSLSPVQNFGIALPINLISFIVLEFNHGTIRNKVIGGNSKASVYISIYISSLIFTFMLLTGYILITTGLGTLYASFSGGGFDVNGPISLTNSTPGSIHFFIRIIIVTVVSYITVTSLTVFFSTLFRNIGPSIAVVLVLLLILYMSSWAISAINMGIAEMDAMMKQAAEASGETYEPILGTELLSFIMLILSIVNPMHALASAGNIIDDIGTENARATVDTLTFIMSIVNNLTISAALFVGGLFIFKKRDIK